MLQLILMDYKLKHINSVITDSTEYIELFRFRLNLTTLIQKRLHIDSKNIILKMINQHNNINYNLNKYNIKDIYINLFN